MPVETRQEQQELFERVLEMKSCNGKLGHPKMQNWFAWNQAAHTQMQEFHATKYVFETQLGADQIDNEEDNEKFSISPSADPRKQLRAILAHGGGLPLVYKVMSDGLLSHTRILFYAEKACWDYYTEHVTNLKTPLDAINYSISLCNDKWKSEPHLWIILECTLFTPDHLRKMEIPLGKSDLAHKALKLAWNLLSQRAWTMSRYGCPPDSSVGMLSKNKTKLLRQQRR